jgi:myo-inositol-1(or 4)-monophosphatase
MGDDPVDLVRLAEHLAADVGQEVVRHRARGMGEVLTKSSSTDMVTEVDKAAEALIVAALRAARPQDGLVGEEGSSVEGTSGIRWLIDPIDGTTNFLYAVAVPSLGALFSAARGHGAHCDGEDIRCSDKADLATALVGTGFSYQPDRRAEQGMVLSALLPRVRDVRRFGAASTDLCFVASGRLDVYYEAGLAPWDLAAGEIIAREAGAALSDLQGGPIRAGSILACAPALHEPFLALLGALGPPG